MDKKRTESIYSITAEHLFRLISNPVFRRNVRELGNLNNINEMTFSVAQNIHNPQYLIGEVGEGERHSTSGAGVGDFLLDCADGKDAYNLIALHSHPSGEIFPSVIEEDGVGGDLSGLALMRRGYLEGRKLSIRPIEGIVRSLDGKTIDVLLIQEASRIPVSPVILRDYEITFSNIFGQNPEEVARILEETGLYKALHVPFNQKRLPKKFLKMFRKFEFSPEYVQ